MGAYFDEKVSFLNSYLYSRKRNERDGLKNAHPDVIGHTSSNCSYGGT